MRETSWAEARKIIDFCGHKADVFPVDTAELSPPRAVERAFDEHSSRSKTTVAPLFAALTSACL
jgi:hypothetical protein